MGSSDALVQNIIQSRFGQISECNNFRLSVATAMDINGEFNATAQIDPIPGGPNTIQGATIYTGAVSDNESPMFCQGSVGPPMNKQGVMNFAIPLAIGTSSSAVKLSGPTNVLVAVAISYGSTEENMKTCVLYQVVNVTPGP